MIKKFNEDWSSYLDFENESELNRELNVTPSDSFLSAITKAKNMALKQNRVIKVNFLSDNITLYVDKYSNEIKLQNEFLNQKDKKKTKFKIGDKVYLLNNILQSPNDKYKFIITNIIDEDLYEIKLEGGKKLKVLSKYLRLVDNQIETKKEVIFETGFEIIGLPSGQVIYMNAKQVNWFKARGNIQFIKTWKKPSKGGFIPIKLEKYCFEDKFYKNIIDMMDTISW
jgi:hypothetical protein